MLHQNPIDGEWIGGEAVPNLNPSDTNEVVGEYARASKADAPALRRPQEIELRPARAGPLRRRVLHHREDGLHIGLAALFCLQI